MEAMEDQDEWGDMNPEEKVRATFPKALLSTKFTRRFDHSGKSEAFALCSKLLDNWIITSNSMSFVHHY